MPLARTCMPQAEETDIIRSSAAIVGGKNQPALAHAYSASGARLNPERVASGGALQDLDGQQPRAAGDAADASSRISSHRSLEPVPTLRWAPALH